MKHQLKSITLSTDVYTVDDLKDNFQSISYLTSNNIGQEEIIAAINNILSIFIERGETHEY